MKNNYNKSNLLKYSVDYSMNNKCNMVDVLLESKTVFQSKYFLNP
jgi:hypothetical protein